MLRFLSHRVGDRRLIRLIHNWLLSNIYPHYPLGLWVQQWRTRNAKGDVIIVRYADDSVMGFQYEGEAQRFLQACGERLVRRGNQRESGFSPRLPRYSLAHFGLQLHPEETLLIRFGRYAVQQCRERGIHKPETFAFLGITHCCGVRRNDGGFKIVRLTIKKRMRATLAVIRETLMRRRHEPGGKGRSVVTASVTGVFELPCGARQSKTVGRFPMGGRSSMATRIDASKPATPHALGPFPKAASQRPATVTPDASASSHNIR